MKPKAIFSKHKTICVTFPQTFNTGLTKRKEAIIKEIAKATGHSQLVYILDRNRYELESYIKSKLK